MYCTPKVRHKTFGVFFMKYSYEQRLIIVSRVKQGELIAHLSKEYHINNGMGENVGQIWSFWTRATTTLSSYG